MKVIKHQTTSFHKLTISSDLIETLSTNHFLIVFKKQFLFNTILPVKKKTVKSYVLLLPFKPINYSKTTTDMQKGEMRPSLLFILYILQMSANFQNWSSNWHYKWHAAKWLGSISRSRGCSSLHLSDVYKQRVWSRHPEGGLIGFGTSPCSKILVRWISGFGIGIALNNAWV